MTKVTLLGDSIRMLGYGVKVPNLLGGDFEVYQPNDNGRFAKYTLRGLFDWKNDMKGSRIVHWNNGLWDVCKLFGEEVFTSEDEYVDNMLKIADILAERHEKVIFATTTPVRTQNKCIKNSNIERYNSLITPFLIEKGIIINDLYSLISVDIDKYISKDDNIHLTEDGINVCAEQVARVISETSKMMVIDFKEKDVYLNKKLKNDDAPV